MIPPFEMSFAVMFFLLSHPATINFDPVQSTDNNSTSFSKPGFVSMLKDDSSASAVSCFFSFEFLVLQRSFPFGLNLLLPPDYSTFV